MVKAKTALLLNVCILSFNIIAMMGDAEASEIDCLRIIWYLLSVITCWRIVGLINRVAAIITLGDHEISLRTTIFWHNSKIVASSTLLC